MSQRHCVLLHNNYVRAIHRMLSKCVCRTRDLLFTGTCGESQHCFGQSIAYPLIVHSFHTYTFAKANFLSASCKYVHDSFALRGDCQVTLWPHNSIIDQYIGLRGRTYEWRGLLINCTETQHGMVMLKYEAVIYVCCIVLSFHWGRILLIAPIF